MEKWADYLMISNQPLFKLLLDFVRTSAADKNEEMSVKSKPGTHFSEWRKKADVSGGWQDVLEHYWWPFIMGSDNIGEHQGYQYKYISSMSLNESQLRL